MEVFNKVFGGFPKRQLHVSAGLIFRDGLMLINQRPSDKAQSGSWEFPGGKIEPSETPEQALKRELKEEIGIDVQQSEYLFTHHYEYPTHHVILEIFRVSQFLGEPIARENQTLAWVTPEQLSEYPLLEANQEMLEKIYDFWLKKS